MKSYRITDENLTLLMDIVKAAWLLLEDAEEIDVVDHPDEVQLGVNKKDFDRMCACLDRADELGWDLADKESAGSFLHAWLESLTNAKKVVSRRPQYSKRRFSRTWNVGEK